MYSKVLTFAPLVAVALAESSASTAAPPVYETMTAGDGSVKTVGLASSSYVVYWTSCTDYIDQLNLQTMTEHAVIGSSTLAINMASAQASIRACNPGPYTRYGEMPSCRGTEGVSEAAATNTAAGASATQESYGQTSPASTPKVSREHTYPSAKHTSTPCSTPTPTPHHGPFYRSGMYNPSTMSTVVKPAGSSSEAYAYTGRYNPATAEVSARAVVSSSKVYAYTGTYNTADYSLTYDPAVLQTSASAEASSSTFYAYTGRYDPAQYSSKTYGYSGTYDPATARAAATAAPNSS